jgi:hypothetical protein
MAMYGKKVLAQHLQATVRIQPGTPIMSQEVRHQQTLSAMKSVQMELPSHHMQSNFPSLSTSQSPFEKRQKEISSAKQVPPWQTPLVLAPAPTHLQDLDARTASSFLNTISNAGGALYSQAQGHLQTQYPRVQLATPFPVMGRAMGKVGTFAGNPSSESIIECPLCLQDTNCLVDHANYCTNLDPPSNEEERAKNVQQLLTAASWAASCNLDEATPRSSSGTLSSCSSTFSTPVGSSSSLPSRWSESSSGSTTLNSGLLSSSSVSPVMTPNPAPENLQLTVANMLINYKEVLGADLYEKAMQAVFVSSDNSLHLTLRDLLPHEGSQNFTELLVAAIKHSK